MNMKVGKIVPLPDETNRLQRHLDKIPPEVRARNQELNRAEWAAKLGARARTREIAEWLESLQDNHGKDSIQRAEFVTYKRFAKRVAKELRQRYPDAFTAPDGGE